MSTRFGANDFYIKMRKEMRLHKILMVVFFVVILGLGVIGSVVFSFNELLTLFNCILLVYKTSYLFVLFLL